jgi:hypothetical protein
MLNSDTARGRGIRTGIQAALAALATFVVGLLLTVWKVPGVDTAVISYVQAHIVEVLLAIGVPAGITSYIWNLIRKDVPNK